MNPTTRRIINRLYDEAFIISGYLRSFQNQTPVEMLDPIDIVVTWVDGNDPAWMQEKAKYETRGNNFSTQGNGACRYRDWQFFRYWFRSIEQYAPWVNRVFFVTWGHIPHWLNISAPKLKIIRHSDFIPAEYLPTFNSNPIELNLHRIPSLSEHFIYFNDDVFLARPCKPTDFFVNGKPVCSPIPVPFTPYAQQVSAHILWSTYCVANEYNNFPEAIRKNPELWFSHTNRKYLSYVKRAYRESTIYGGFFSHMGVPLCKSTMQQAWEKYPYIAETCTHKFRTPMDVMHTLFTIENLITGNFSPVPPDYFGKIVDMKSFEQITELFGSRTKRMICFSDSNSYTEADENIINHTIVHLLKQIFPNKSSFEI